MIKAGVIGWPIEQSKSPIIHGHWLELHGISGTYEKIGLSPEGFQAGMHDLIMQGFSGVNITAPHKEPALAMADAISDRAAQIGAANTMTFANGQIHADNTDGEGFISNVMQGAPDWNAASGPALVLGAGGAARAIIWALLDAGVPEIILANRTRARAENLANIFGRQVMVADWDDAQHAAMGVTTLVNTTALGMTGKKPLVLDISALPKTALVTDIVYNPLETDLLATARAQGNIVVDGLGMLLHQAVPGFEAWFGTRPKVDTVLRAKVLAAL